MLWMNSRTFADHALLVWLGRWQNAQLVASLRWPAWKSGPTPSDTWQALHFAFETIARLALNRGLPSGSLSSATFQTSSAGTMRPPTPPRRPGAAGESFGVYG